MSGKAQGTYRRIVTSFWTDPDLRKRKLTRDQKHLLLYFFTNHHTNLSGLYWLPLTYAAAEAELPLEDVERWVAHELSPYVTYDFETEEILVHRLAHHNVGEDLKKRDRRVTAIERALGNAHSRHLVENFLNLYPAWPINRRKVAPWLDLEGASQGAPPSPIPKGHGKGQGVARAVAVAVAGAVSGTGTGAGQEEAPKESGESEGEAPPDVMPAPAIDRSDGLALMLEEYPEAGAVLDALKHRGGADATAATLRLRFVYADDPGAMPDDSVAGLGFDERRRLVADALLDFRDQGATEWNRPHFAGFVRRMRANPNGHGPSMSPTAAEESETEEQRREAARDRAAQHDAEVERMNAEGAELLERAKAAKAWLDTQAPDVQLRVSARMAPQLKRLGVRDVSNATPAIVAPVLIAAVEAYQREQEALARGEL